MVSLVHVPRDAAGLAIVPPLTQKAQPPGPPALRRTIGLSLLSFYGLGTILGAGIYVLVGEVAADAGTAAPLAFVLAGILAGLSAFSFAELSSRIPESAGEAAYVRVAFSRRWLTTAVGWAVVAVGIVSAATMLRGFVGYLGVFVEPPPAVVIIVAVSLLALVAVWGIGESLVVAAVITVIEIAGLLFVCITAGDALGSLPDDWRRLLPGAAPGGVLGIVSGAFVAFYAFIGFEDMVNVAEEVRSPEKTLPQAIILALVASTALYFAVALVAVLAVPVEAIAGNPAPLAVIVDSRGVPAEIIAGISLCAVVNGALVQVIMASRVLYGLASQGLAWQRFARVNSQTQTPIVATVTVAIGLAALAVAFPLGSLARATSFVALGIFCAVNLALLRIKARGERAAFTVPAAVPAAGLVLAFAMMLYEGFSYV